MGAAFLAERIQVALGWTLAPPPMVVAFLAIGLGVGMANDKRSAHGD